MKHLMMIMIVIQRGARGQLRQLVKRLLWCRRSLLLLAIPVAIEATVVGEANRPQVQLWNARSTILTCVSNGSRQTSSA